jgi:chromosome segregation ATPase
MSTPQPRTDAAIQARRQATQEMLERLKSALADMTRNQAPASVAALARTARVSRTFLYQNQQARALIEQANRTQGPRRGTAANGCRRTQPAWKERALNAEDALAQAQREIRTQRTRIAEHLGKIRDLEHDLPEGSLQRIVTENTTLKQQVRQLTQDNQQIQERLASARQNNRFMDKRIADLEAQIAQHLTTQPPHP